MLVCWCVGVLVCEGASAHVSAVEYVCMRVCWAGSLCLCACVVKRGRERGRGKRGGDEYYVCVWRRKRPENMCVSGYVRK